MLTLNQTVKRIQTIALAHLQLRNFYYGNVTDFLTDKTTRYASCFLQDAPGTFDVIGKVVTYNFVMYLLDLENVSEDTQANQLDVQSDMVQVGLDLLAEFDYSGYTDWKIATSSNFELKEEALDDIVAGVMINISIQTPYNKDICSIPNTEDTNVDLFWSYFDSDPYSDIQNKTFIFSDSVIANTGEYDLDFQSTANGNYLAVKELATQPIKELWRNTDFNYGTIPDQVFRDSIIIGQYRYYVSRIPVVIDSTTSIITFNV